MEKKFEVGQRVRLSGFGEVGGESSDVEDCKATVTGNEFRGTVVVKPDTKDWNVRVYPSQCRRLRPKKRRRIWISPANTEHVLSQDLGERVHCWSRKPPCDAVEFVEVRKARP